jgi:hypothetical protein
MPWSIRAVAIASASAVKRSSASFEASIVIT